MNIKIEEILGREAIQITNPLISNEINGKIIMVTGAAGSIGSDIVKLLFKYIPKKIILIDQSESGLYDLSFEIKKINNTNTATQIFISNITDEERMNSIFRNSKPQLVFHAAAYKHVPMLENNPYEAVKVNVIGTRILSNLSIKYGVSKFILISTDKAVNPSSVMGATKKIAEMLVQSMNAKEENNTKFIVTRFGNVVESNGSVIPLFKKQIELGRFITVTHPEITRYFITIQEASQLVLEAVTMGKKDEIFIFDMGKPVKILEIAKKMISLSEKTLEIKYIGLRLGEKLHEELLNYNEKTISTYHPHIKCAKLMNSNYLMIENKLDELNEHLHKNNDLELIARLKKIVPEYKAIDSINQEFDESIVQNILF